MNWPHSATTITIATPAKTVVAASVECVSVASRTASRPTANMALVANKALVRRIRATSRVAGTCATTMKKVLMNTTTPIPTGPTGVCATANGGRMKEKNAPPIITSARLPAIKASKSRSRATARKPRTPSRADEALPRTVDKRQAPVAECVHNIARDQDPFRTETIEERTRRERYHCGRAHDRRQHQPRGRRREAADRVEVDDLEGKDQSGAEVVERVPALKNEDRPR